MGRQTTSESGLGSLSYLYSFPPFFPFSFPSLSKPFTFTKEPIRRNPVQYACVLWVKSREEFIEHHIFSTGQSFQMMMMTMMMVVIGMLDPSDILLRPSFKVSLKLLLWECVCVGERERTTYFRLFIASPFHGLFFIPTDIISHLVILRSSLTPVAWLLAPLSYSYFRIAFHVISSPVIHSRQFLY